MALEKQNVANSPIGSYPVGVFRTAANAELQAIVLVDSTGAEIPSVPGFAIPYYDYVAVTYPTSTTEVYVFKTGGSAGTTVGTITLTYTDATKDSLSSAEKS